MTAKVLGYVLKWKQGSVQKHVFVKTQLQAFEFIKKRRLFDKGVTLEPQIAYSQNPPYQVQHVLSSGRRYTIAEFDSLSAANSARRKLNRKYPKYSAVISESGKILSAPRKLKDKFAKVDLFDQFKTNPSETKIYDRVCEIIAVKGPGHRCDAACRRARHTYRHRFSRKNKVGVYGSPDAKQITLK